MVGTWWYWIQYRTTVIVGFLIMLGQKRTFMSLNNEKRPKSGDLAGCYLSLTDGQKGQNAQLNSAKKVANRDVEKREKGYLF